MQTVTESYSALGLLVDINRDRLLAVLFILAAMAVVATIGVEYSPAGFVDTPASMGGTVL